MSELFVLIFLLVFFALIGLPIAFALGITSAIGIWVYLSPTQLSQMANVSYLQGTSFTLMVAPLFILMSELISNGGISKDIFDVLSRWFKKVPGGLGISNVFACSIFAALCGSSPVTAVTIGKISIPEMINNGYNRAFSIGSTVAGGNIGILIPPSLTLIIYGIITENSISKLFIAGVVPGILLAVGLSLYIYIAVRIKPSLWNLETSKSSDNDKSSASNNVSFLKDVITLGPVFLLIVVVLGSMFLGVTTPTEAAGVGAFGAFILVLSLRRLNWTVFKKVLKDTSKSTAMLMFMIIFGMVFAYIVSSLGIPRVVSHALVSIQASKWIIFTLVMVFWLIAGCFLDPTGLLVITLPILYPPLLELGFDPLWVGIIATMAVCIGMITPPVGLNLYVIKGITNAPFQEVVAGSMPFLLVIVAITLILIAFPQISLFLPNMM